MSQRLGIAQAMLGLPELLVLDEPTNGLDPPQIAEMREVLQRYAETGRTVVVSSHLLAEVEQTCTPRRRHAQGPAGRGRLGGRDRRRRRRCSWPSTIPSGRPRCWPRRASRSHAVPARRALEDVFLDLVGERIANDRRPSAHPARRARTAGRAAAGAPPAFNPRRTLRLRVEFARQLKRRRTQFVAAGPARAADPDRARVQGRRRHRATRRRRAGAGRPGHHRRRQLRAVHRVRVGRVPARRHRRAVLRRHGGQRGQLVVAALPARHPGAARPGCCGRS